MSDLDRLAADLAKAAATVQRDAPNVVGFAGDRAVQSARARVRVRTGVLRNSIGARPSLGGMAVTVEATADHAVFVEHGTSRMRPQPYMAPAADQAEADFVQAMEALGGDVL